MKKIVGCRISVKTKKGGNAGSASLLPDPIPIPSNKQSKGANKLNLLSAPLLPFSLCTSHTFFAVPCRESKHLSRMSRAISL